MKKLRTLLVPQFPSRQSAWASLPRPPQPSPDARDWQGAYFPKPTHGRTTFFQH